jgi:hypothetical protein
MSIATKSTSVLVGFAAFCAIGGGVAAGHFREHNMREQSARRVMQTFTQVQLR